MRGIDDWSLKKFPGNCAPINVKRQRWHSYESKSSVFLMVQPLNTSYHHHYQTLITLHRVKGKMALVSQVATVAQLVGVDAYGLITMIAEAARTVRRNRATCRQLARRVEMIGDLLRQLHEAQALVAQRPETRRPVEELEETLRRAYLLVRSCQRRGYAYRCFMGTWHADELREVQGEIGFYLQLFPLVSYVDATLAWARLLNKADHPSCNEEPMNNKVPGPQAQLPVRLSPSLSLQQQKHDEQDRNVL